MTEESAVSYEVRGPAAVVTINRPDRMNALSREVVDGLQDARRRAEANPAVRAVVVTGAGGRAFCAGADLKERRSMSDDDVRAFLADLRSTFDGIAESPKPFIAAINGYALGGGLELALCCDIRIASVSAKMGLTEVRLAIIPGAGGTQRLPRAVGVARATEMILTGRRVQADEAERIGLVSDVVAGDELVDRACEIADAIALGGPLAIEQAKFAIRRGTEVDLTTGLAIERKAYEVLIPTSDRVEALDAFREKRPPDFKGK